MSADFCLGLPFNVYQYHVLHATMAKFTGLELGDLHWNIDNLHVYERHLEKLSAQLLAYKLHKVETAQETQLKPELKFPDNFNYEDFFANKLSEVEVLSYTPLGGYKYEIAI